MPKLSPLSTEEQEKVLELYKMEFSTRQIARMIHWSQDVVLNCLHLYAVEMRPSGGNRMKITGKEIEQVRFLHDNMGYSQRDIATILGRSNDWVNRRVRKGGINARPYGWQGQLQLKRKLT